MGTNKKNKAKSVQAPKNVPKEATKPKHGHKHGQKPHADKARAAEKPHNKQLKTDKQTKNHDKSAPAGKAKFDKKHKNQTKNDKHAEAKHQAADEKPNEKLTAMLKALKDQSTPWYEAVKLLPNEDKNQSKFSSTSSIVEGKKKVAERLLEAELKAMDSKSSLSSDEKYLKTMMKSGTLADRIAATTLAIQGSPVHNLARLGQLVAMAKNKGRRESQMAIESLKDLFLNNLLPDRKLHFFHQQPIDRSDVTQEHLVIWYFEHCLKNAYAQLIAALSSGMDNAIESHKRTCIRAVVSLLTDKPEQESVLLSMLVNKLGDPDRKIASYCLHQLQELLKVHPVMKRVVVDDVERLLTRTKVTERTKYNAVLFLNQMYLSSDDADLATHLIKVYFGLFSKEVHNDVADAGLERKILSALLVGVNRSFPYAKSTSADFKDEIDTMFRVVHTAHFSTSVQALMLLFQVMNSTNSVPDRFYTAMYAKLFDPRVQTSSKHTLFLNLIFRAIKQDVSPARVHAMIKRLLQVSLTMQPAFCCAALFLVSELMQHNKAIRALIDQAEHDITQDQPTIQSKNDSDDDEHEERAEGEDSEDSSDSKESNDERDENEVKAQAELEEERKRSAALLKTMGLIAEPTKTTTPTSSAKVETITTTQYDPRKRNPLYAGADMSCLWELQPFLVHYHPSVAQFAKQLIDGAISYKGDPLKDFTLSVFFDKFVNKKPKTKDGPHRYSGAKNENAPVSFDSEEFLAQDEGSVAENDRFFYTFFKERAKRVPAKAKKAKDDMTGDALASDDEEYEAFANQLAESIMEDNDDEDPDMDDWSGPDDDSDNEGADDDDDEGDAPGDAPGDDDMNDEDRMFADEDDDDDEDMDDDEVDEDEQDDEDDEDEVKVRANGKKSAPQKRKSPFADADDYLEAIEKAVREEQAAKPQSKKKRK
ncbi:hypothetical protein LEN26_010179 [Aphanomyces euteiches]|nr:hypothetical protein LEN26_010179 [Aphanomyces euteiches]